MSTDSQRLAEALRFAAQSDVYLRQAADAERRGEAEIARDLFIMADAWDLQAVVTLG